MMAACVRCGQKSWTQLSKSGVRWLMTGRARLCDKTTSSQSHDAFADSETIHQTSQDYERDDREYEKEGKEHQVKEQILAAALKFVPEHGWTRHALKAGAEAEGLPPVTHGLFPRGGAQLISHFYRSCNSSLAEQLSQQVQQEAEEAAQKKKTSKFIRDAVETRLRMIEPYMEQWPQAMAIQTLPQNAPESLKNLAQLVDDIWYHAGDRSTDFSWYTKRATLAAIYKSTEFCMVQDRSEDFEKTWKFLDNRLKDAAFLGKMSRQLQLGGDVLSEGLWSALQITRNVIGANARNR